VTTRRLTFLALWIATSVALGYLLAGIPNVELVTASIYLGGALAGPLFGVIIGAVAEFLYSLVSPFGMAAPPLLIAQLLSMALAGLAGGLTGPALFRGPKPLMRHLFCGLVGLALTAFFDLLTTASFLVFSGLSLEKLAVSFFFGLGFYATHIVWNTAIFATAVPILGRKLPTLLPDLR